MEPRALPKIKPIKPARMLSPSSVEYQVSPRWQDSAKLHLDYRKRAKTNTHIFLKNKSINKTIQKERLQEN